MAIIAIREMFYRWQDYSLLLPCKQEFNTFIAKFTQRKERRCSEERY